VKAFDWHSSPITRKTPMTATYRNTQNVQRFFQSQCGAHFNGMAQGGHQQDHGGCGHRMAKTQAPRGVAAHSLRPSVAD
jgi:hypothetical protein